jgi:hypothetical protein
MLQEFSNERQESILIKPFGGCCGREQSLPPERAIVPAPAKGFFLFPAPDIPLEEPQGLDRGKKKNGTPTHFPVPSA